VGAFPHREFINFVMPPLHGIFWINTIWIHAPLAHFPILGGIDIIFPAHRDIVYIFNNRASHILIYFLIVYIPFIRIQRCGHAQGVSLKWHISLLHIQQSIVVEGPINSK
jgi:hypothetical protein